jgi:hypothetical protein
MPPLKIGVEDRKKVIIASVLGVIAVACIFYMYSSVFGGPSTPAPAVQAELPRQRSASISARGDGATVTTTTGSAGAVHNAALTGSSTLDPALRFDLLAQSETTEYKGTGRNIFSLTAPPPPIEEVKAPIRPVDSGPPAPPPKPPINLKFYGYETAKNGKKRVFLVNPNQDVFIAAEGDVVDRRYRVVKIGNNSVQIEDILNDNTQPLTPEPGGPA